jgi:lipoxygenase homology domain-containing protein 1
LVDDRVDEFIVPAQWVGKLERLLLRHDNTGINPGWFVDKVIVEDMETNDVYEFPCQRWLAKDEDGEGHLARMLTLNGVDGMCVLRYYMSVKSSRANNY